MKIAVLFPGYGSHLVGSAKELYDHSRLMQEYFEEASSCLGINTVKLCFASNEAEQSKMDNAHIILFLLSSALYKVLEERHIPVELLTGYNTGMYAALFAANSITFPDGLYLAAKYATLFEEFIGQLPFKLIRVFGIAADQLEEWCTQESNQHEPASIVAYYTQEVHEVSGNSHAVDRIIHRVGLRGTVQELPLQYGMHSALVDDVAYMYEPYLQKVDIKQPQLKVLSQLNGHLLTTDELARSEVVSFINTPLYFTRILDVLALHDIIVEVGSGTFLPELIKTVYPDKKVLIINKQADIDALHELTHNTISP
jgi:[acyl-carrier-protein] S-malonyltransferase